MSEHLRLPLDPFRVEPGEAAGLADRDPEFSRTDVEERGHWDDYMAAYEAAIGATSSAEAPWYVVPADHLAEARAILEGEG